jgi:hypothetical protein
MHQVLVEQITPAQASIFSKGKTWQEIESVLQLKRL